MEVNLCDLGNFQCGNTRFSLTKKENAFSLEDDYTLLVANEKSLSYEISFSSQIGFVEIKNYSFFSKKLFFMRLMAKGFELIEENRHYFLFVSKDESIKVFKDNMYKTIRI